MADKEIGKTRIVCLGGGIGTSVLISGLKKYTPHITVITSMADDGGSSGRLRKAYGILPPGDLISCIAALVDNKDLASLLTYRFPGKSRDNKAIDGHKLGNLIMLAEFLRTKDIYKALDVTKRMFEVKGDILPASDERVHMKAITEDGRLVHGETALDLVKYAEPYGVKKIYLTPKNPRVNPKVVESLENADLIITGPGDFYTNELPVLLIPEIKNALLKRNCRKIFVLNIANKPFETKGYELSDFIKGTKEHLGKFPFDTVIANANISAKIPHKYRKYKFIKVAPNTKWNFKLVLEDVVDSLFPIYHDSNKLAKAIIEKI